MLSDAMRIALCNEVIAPMPFPAQCEYAAKLGYDGLEVAPYTLSEEPQRMGTAQIAAARAAAEDAGIVVTGLHWLLVKPAGLSITARDDGVRRRTVDAMLALIDLCAELGGRYLVHGSPQQRRIEAGGGDMAVPLRGPSDSERHRHTRRGQRRPQRLPGQFARRAGDRHRSILRAGDRAR